MPSLRGKRHTRDRRIALALSRRKRWRFWTKIAEMRGKWRQTDRLSFPKSMTKMIIAMILVKQRCLRLRSRSLPISSASSWSIGFTRAPTKTSSLWTRSRISWFRSRPLVTSRKSLWRPNSRPGSCQLFWPIATSPISKHSSTTLVSKWYHSDSITLILEVNFTLKRPSFSRDKNRKNSKTKATLHN